MTMAVKTVFQLLPKEFDEKVVKLHFPALGANYRRFEVRAAFRARRATVLCDRGLLPESSRTGARSATVLRRRGLLPESSRTRGARLPASERSRSGSREPKL